MLIIVNLHSFSVKKNYIRNVQFMAWRYSVLNQTESFSATRKSKINPLPQKGIADKTKWVPFKQTL